MKSLKLIISVALISISQMAYSSVAMNSYQIPDNISVMADGTIEVIFPEIFNEGCTVGGGKRMFIQAGNSQGVTQDSLMQIQSLILSSAISKTPIMIWYDRIDTTCEGGKVAIDVS